MRFNFLCAVHRQQLESDPSRAVRLWQDGLDTTQFYCEQGMWPEAISHAGCAFEIADIILSHRFINYLLACDRFCYSTLLISEIFSRLDCENEARQVLTMAIDRYERELNLSTLGRDTIADCLNQLYVFGSAHLSSSDNYFYKTGICSPKITIN